MYRRRMKSWRVMCRACGRVKMSNTSHYISNLIRKPSQAATPRAILHNAARRSVARLVFISRDPFLALSKDTKGRSLVSCYSCDANATGGRSRLSKWFLLQTLPDRSSTATAFSLREVTTTRALPGLARRGVLKTRRTAMSSLR